MSELMNLPPSLTILTHSIERATLPTWHSCRNKSDSEETPPSIRNDAEYARAIRFLSVPADGTSSNARPPDGIQPELYFVGADPFDPESRPFPFETFTREHSNPQVLWFQPYTKDTESVARSATLGIKIEQECIDATVIPTPNPDQSLTYNNSVYYCGTIPVLCIKSFIPDGTPNVNLQIPKRVSFAQRSRPNCMVFRDMSRNVVPQFAANACRDVFTNLYGFNVVNNVNNTTTAYTYTAWKTGQAPSIPANSVYLWSSYRTKFATERSR